MLLYSYYSLDEVIDIKEVLTTLESLKKEGKMKYHIESDIISVEDLDLDDNDIEIIGFIFDKNDVFPYLERNVDDDGDDDIFGYYSDYDNDDY
jgi:hypothetical protein